MSAYRPIENFLFGRKLIFAGNSKKEQEKKAL